MQSFVPAETSPIDRLELPDTMTNLTFVNLPKLVYPNGGLTVAGLGRVKRFHLAGCKGIDMLAMLNNAINDGAQIKEISLKNLEVTADTTILDALQSSGAKGIGSDIDYGCDGLTGSWILTHLISDSKLDELKAYFPEMVLHNAQYTLVKFDDQINDPKNITNMDNGTSGDGYAPSGHIMRIRERLIPVKGKLNAAGVWEGERMSDSDYHKLSDGTDFDYKDELGNGFDAMMRCPDLWYKGINDFKNQTKYIAWSSLVNEPLSTARNMTRKKLKDIIFIRDNAIAVTDIMEGSSTLDGDGIILATPNFNVYQLEVTGMKQVRWPGVNHSVIGAAFLNEDGVIIKKYNMAVSNQLFDFVDGDYIFIDVPKGAKNFVFASNSSNNEEEAIAIDSSEIEAIEPDWVFNKAWLGGIYQASVDNIMQLRSISGAKVQTGTVTSDGNTSAEWIYDADGRPTNTPVGELKYSGKDLQNLAWRRGKGYQLFDYEMSKLMAILWMSLNGTRDAQFVCGYGKSSGGTTGYKDSLGNSDSVKGSGDGNKCLGFESFFGCTWEFMDYVGINIESYAQWMKEKCGINTANPRDAVWHIYDPISKTERTVQGIKTSGYCIGRVKHGRHCDVIASKCTSDNSVWAANYTDCQYYTDSNGRVVGRSSSNANAHGGLVYAHSYYASSYSSTHYGGRLAFRGAISVKA